MTLRETRAVGVTRRPWLHAICRAVSFQSGRNVVHICSSSTVPTTKCVCFCCDSVEALSSRRAVLLFLTCYAQYFGKLLELCHLADLVCRLRSKPGWCCVCTQQGGFRLETQECIYDSTCSVWLLTPATFCFEPSHFPDLQVLARRTHLWG